MRSHVTSRCPTLRTSPKSFNTASGMRSHVTRIGNDGQDRRRIGFNTASGMRSHVTHTPDKREIQILTSFNTASGMRSHVTYRARIVEQSSEAFQYRKRYEITCDLTGEYEQTPSFFGFNTASGMRSHVTAVRKEQQIKEKKGFNTASGMRSHVTTYGTTMWTILSGVSIPQAV